VPATVRQPRERAIELQMIGLAALDADRLTGQTLD
jgi:hypothetical protein